MRFIYYVFIALTYVVDPTSQNKHILHTRIP